MTASVPTWSGAPRPPWWHLRARLAWRREELAAARRRVAVLELTIASLCRRVEPHAGALIRHRARIEALLIVNGENPQRRRRLAALIERLDARAIVAAGNQESEKSESTEVRKPESRVPTPDDAVVATG